jgi:hypothetical protein
MRAFRLLQCLIQGKAFVVIRAESIGETLKQVSKIKDMNTKSMVDVDSIIMYRIPQQNGVVYLKEIKNTCVR